MTVVRALLLTAVAASVLSACNRDREPAEVQAPAPEAPAALAAADAAAPLAFESRTPWADVALTLPDAVETQADLHATLYADEVRRLRQFTEGAQGELTEAGADTDRPKYQKTVTITTAAETAKLLSLKRTDFDYSGGAHPNTLTDGLLWDKALKRRVGVADLFARGADLTVLDQALCSAINAAKRARSPGSAGVSLDSKEFSCPRAAATPFVLTPGDAPGKAAGLTFLIGPYQVGPYVEGAYEIAIPATVFRSLLATPYASEFGGRLTRAGDVTPSAPAAVQSARN